VAYGQGEKGGVFFFPPPLIVRSEKKTTRPLLLNLTLLSFP